MGNVERFFDALAKDEAMRKRAYALNEKYKDIPPDKNAVAAEFLAYANAEGYDFTEEELVAYANAAKKVPEGELENVAGGVYDSDHCFCIFGGGGKDKDTGQVCVCPILGAGNKDKDGQFLLCGGAGLVGKS
jgi:hypothetical protein